MFTPLERTTSLLGYFSFSTTKKLVLLLCTSILDYFIFLPPSPGLRTHIQGRQKYAHKHSNNTVILFSIALLIFGREWGTIETLRADLVFLQSVNTTTVFHPTKILQRKKREM
jgi:hypothetical protein